MTKPSESSKWRPHPASLSIYSAVMQHWGPPELYSTSGEYCITPAVCYAIKYVGVYIPAGQRSVRIKLILPAQGGACAATGYHAVAGVIPKR